MGPGSDNPGYGPNLMLPQPPAVELQWVQGPITLVMNVVAVVVAVQVQASMGPGSDNPGYASEPGFLADDGVASMGPGSDNPGYEYP